jgi:flagellar basal-body rod modification protein FlgD
MNVSISPATSPLPGRHAAAAASGASQSSPAGSSTGSSGPPANTSLSPSAIQQQFLTLLVAQLKNQDPLNPQDPSQFLSQLASINNVEQLVQANQTLTAIQSDLTANSPAGTRGTGTSPAGNTTNS